MGFRTAVKTCLRNIWKYSGRASRTKYWYCVFCYLLVACVAFGVILPLGAGSRVDLAGHRPWSAGGEDLPQVMVLAVYKPLQFCTLYLPEAPASLLMLYVTLRKGTPGPNRYGHNPLAEPGEEAAWILRP
ncbi:DUF805 domain-containing protein [uncultured Desulfovibrio sp.]|uniref:DUF805 domain-containing protein n=1 Tax=uncultured Desulfovibrio sp. TaxID=167968 RepID=UPI0003AB03EC|nr:DUF805 domain-containing protein [uncultured Desulfovibrio sp.]